MEVEVDENDLKAAGAELLPGGSHGIRIQGWEVESLKRSILSSSTLQLCAFLFPSFFPLYTCTYIINIYVFAFDRVILDGSNRKQTVLRFLPSFLFDCSIDFGVPFVDYHQL